jgi:hypothetical protein
VPIQGHHPPDEHVVDVPGHPLRSWGVNAERDTPRDFYDGVLFIHTTTPPEYPQ